MEYFILIGLTFGFICTIIILRIQSKNNYFNKVIYRQSDMHNLLKKFFLLEINDKEKKSQFNKRKEKDITKVVILDNKAYWVINSVFYVGDVVNDKVIPESGIPLDTQIMSTEELNKLLFILDKLKDGDYNDSGSTGN